MKDLLSWTLESIRDVNADLSWMEEHYYDWTPLAQSAISNILQGKSVLILTDQHRRWFGHYIQHKINDTGKKRPLLPFYQLTRMFQNFDDLNTTQDMELLEDMLDISFPNGYFIWYIGKGDHPYTKLVYKNDESFMWIVDSQIQNAFRLNGDDPYFDIKLLQLFKLFDNTLSELLFGNLEIEL